MDGPNQNAIKIVKHYIDTVMPGYLLHCDTDEQFTSYYSFGAYEALSALEANPSIPPLETLETLSVIIQSYACRNDKTSYLFWCAGRAIGDILKLFGQ